MMTFQFHGPAADDGKLRIGYQRFLRWNPGIGSV
jgi:hypothetical protein